MVKLMADEIEYLRAQLVGAKIAQAHRTGGAIEEHDFFPDARTSPHYTREEQEEIQALREGGHIDAVEYAAAMKAIGVQVTDVQLPDDPHGFFADDE